MKNNPGLAGLLAVGTLFLGNPQLINSQEKEEREKPRVVITYEYPSYSDVGVLYTRKMLNAARHVYNRALDSGYDLSKQYEEDSPEEKIQYDLLIKTGTLHSHAIGDLNDYSISFSKEGINHTFDLLDEVEKLFGAHLAHHVLIGRQKNLARVVKGEVPYHLLESPERAKSYRKKNSGHIAKQNFPLNERLSEFAEHPIPNHQNPYLNNTRLDQIPSDREDHVPPEYREQWRASQQAE